MSTENYQKITNEMAGVKNSILRGETHNNGINGVL
jgi:hypothetical protein